MAALTEQQILNIVYSLYETDDTNWDTDSSEYLSGRVFANAAIVKWQNYNNTVWRELWGTLAAAADGTKTITAGTYNYSTPTNFTRPSSWVRTTDSNGSNTYWEVVSPEKVGKLADSKEFYCYFTGSVKDGFKVNFNPNITLTTGDTINYEYYKTASQFTTTTSTTEVPDPYFIVYFILARFLKNDGEDYGEEMDMADSLLENMRVANLTGYFDVPDQMEQSTSSGFGY